MYNLGSLQSRYSSYLGHGNPPAPNAHFFIFFIFIYIFIFGAHRHGAPSVRPAAAIVFFFFFSSPHSRRIGAVALWGAGTSSGGTGWDGSSLAEICSLCIYGGETLLLDPLPTRGWHGGGGAADTYICGYVCWKRGPVAAHKGAAGNSTLSTADGCPMARLTLLPVRPELMCLAGEFAGAT